VNVNEKEANETVALLPFVTNTTLCVFELACAVTV
jgi:hypothetical protein